jgi:hypothetical protein
MSATTLPKILSSPDALDKLIALLKETDRQKRELKARDFGPPVCDPTWARRLFQKVVGCAGKVADVGDGERPLPKLLLGDSLGKLPCQTFKSYLFFAPVTVVLAAVAVVQSGEWPELAAVGSAGVVLLALPLVVGRRIRLHLTHHCGYVRDEQGTAVIVMERLPLVTFQSYLAHEYAHHLFFSATGEGHELWVREGWARWIQWLVVNEFCLAEGNPAYLHDVLVQVIGELKFACQFLAAMNHRRLPFRVRRTQSPYHANPLFRLVTGTPGFAAAELMHHAMGTASFFLYAQDEKCSGPSSRIGIPGILSADRCAARPQDAGQPHEDE